MIIIILLWIANDKEPLLRFFFQNYFRIFFYTKIVSYTNRWLYHYSSGRYCQKTRRKIILLHKVQPNIISCHTVELLTKSEKWKLKTKSVACLVIVKEHKYAKIERKLSKLSKNTRKCHAETFYIIVCYSISWTCVSQKNTLKMRLLQKSHYDTRS